MALTTGANQRRRAAGIRGIAAAEIETAASAGKVPAQNPAIEPRGGGNTLQGGRGQRCGVGQAARKEAVDHTRHQASAERVRPCQASAKGGVDIEVTTDEGSCRVTSLHFDEPPHAH